MHIKKPRRNPVQPLDVGATPEALLKANIEAVDNGARMPSTHRKVPMHRKLHDGGKIENAEYEWTERYISDCEIERGASPERSLVERCEVDSGYTSVSLADIQIAAASRLRRARGKMTKQQREILESACVDCHRIADVAIVCGKFPRDDETMKAFSDRVQNFVFKAVTKSIKAGAGPDPEISGTKTAKQTRATV